MKTVFLGIDTGTAVFAPGAANTGTITISGVAGFNIARVKQITDATAGRLLYIAQGSGYTGTWSDAGEDGAVLTLAADTSALASDDQLQIEYRTIDPYATDANLTYVGGAIVAALGVPFQSGGSIGNTAFGISGTLPAFAATPTFNLGTLNGAATAAAQATGNTSLASINTSNTAINTALGAQADSTWDGAAAASAIAILRYIGTKIEAARALLAGTLTATLAAGTNLIGAVKTPYAVATATLTRPANTTAYSIGDAVTDTGGAAITLTLGDVNDDPFTLEKIRLYTADTGPGTATAQFEAWIYNAAVTPSTDNAGFSVTGAGLIGRMVGTFIATASGSFCELIPYNGGRLVTTPISGAKTVNVVLKTLTAWTPSANSTTFLHTAEGFRGKA